MNFDWGAENAISPYIFHLMFAEKVCVHGKIIKRHIITKGH